MEGSLGPRGPVEMGEHPAVHVDVASWASPTVSQASVEVRPRAVGEEEAQQETLGL